MKLPDVESYNDILAGMAEKTEDNGPWMDEYHENIQTAASDCRSMVEGIIYLSGGNPKCVKITARHTGRIPRIYGSYVRETPLDFLLICMEYV